MSRAPALLIAGTDTGVGKTVVGVLLITALRRLGLTVAAMKPVETGCDPDPLDALSLGVAAELPQDQALLCPYRFRLPVAPQAAAVAEHASIELAVIRQGIDRLRAEADLLVVESAGGLGTPYGPDLLVMDLAHQLELPVLLVARDILGTVGQTLVALRAMRHQGVRCLGVVLSQVSAAPPGPDQASNAALIAAHAKEVPVLGSLPFLPEPMPGPGAPQALRDWANRQQALFLERLSLTRLAEVLAAGPGRTGREVS